MLVLRSIGVYAVSAAALLWLAHRFVRPLGPRVAIVLACAPLLFTGRALVTGGAYGGLDILYDAPPFRAHRDELRVPPDRSPNQGDVVTQHVPWRAAVRRALAHGELPLWNPDVLAGEPLLAVQQPAVLQPATWLGLALPLPEAWTFDVTLRLLAALVCAFLFLRELGCGVVPSLLGAAGWAFCDDFLFFLGFPNASSMAPFPLALLGARRLAREPGRRGAALLVVALAAGLAGGHPETVLHTGSATGLYFLFELAAAGPGRRARSFLVALGCAALSLGLCAVLLLPLAETLPGTVQHYLRVHSYAFEKRSVPWSDSLFRLVPQLVPYAVGVDGPSRVKDGFLVPSSYAGILLVPFAVAGLAGRRREAWFFLGLALLALSVCTKTFAADLIAKLPFFDIAINEYLILLPALSVCILAALGAERLRQGSGRLALAAGGVATLLAVSVLYRLYAPLMKSLGMSAGYRRERLLLQLLPLLLGVGAALAPRRLARHGLAAALVVFVASRVLEEGRVQPVVRADAVYPPVPILAAVPRGTPYRIAGVGPALMPNVAAVYGLEDVRGYEAMILGDLWQTFPFWCVPQGVLANRVEDPTTPFLAFLNVRWVLTAPEAPVPEGWPVLAESDGLRLLENPRALPRVFVPRRTRGEPDAGRRLALLGQIRDFGELGVTTSGADANWVENGRARVTIESYGRQRIVLGVEAEAPALVGSSITNWPGWKAELDGRPLPTVPYNNAFLAFRVPAGSHRLDVRYAPDGFRYGAAISLATAVLCLALVRRPRGRSPRSEPGIPA